MPSPLHIAIDAGYIEDIQEGNGFYTYLSNLLTQIKPFAKKAPYHFHLFSFFPISLPFPQKNFTHTQFPVPPNHSHQQRRKVFLKLFQKAVINNPNKIDIVFFPHLEFPKNLNIFREHNIRIILTIHDLIPTYFFSPSLLFSKKLRLRTLTTKGIVDFFTVRKRISQWDTVLTVSETSKKQILNILPEKSRHLSNIVVTPLGANPLFKPHGKPAFQTLHKNLAKKSFNPAQPSADLDSATQTNTPHTKLNLRYKHFILYFGGYTIRKNVAPIVQACIETLGELPQLKDFKIVLVGYGNWVRKLVEQNLHTNLIFLKNLSQDELAVLIASARYTLQPSLIEGFGLPVLESIMSHTLPISSNIPTSIDILGKEFPMFDPYDMEEAKRILRLFLTLTPTQETQLLKKALPYAKTFTWKRTAELTHQVFQKLS